MYLVDVVVSTKALYSNDDTAAELPDNVGFNASNGACCNIKKITYLKAAKS